MAAFFGLNFVRAVLLALAVAYIAKWIYQRRRQRQHDAAFARINGCLPVKSVLPYSWPFGLDVLKKQYDALPSQRLLAFQSRYFDRLDPTFAVNLFGTTGYMTTDPRNIEAINVSKFEDYGLGSRRQGCLPFLGEGIFVQDAIPWKHSRELLRRQFARVQYHELGTFQDHVEALVSRLSAVKGVVDLQPAFFDFTLSTTTTLLFGEAIDSLGDEAQADFSENFEHATYVTAIRIRLADLCWAYTPTHFIKSCEVVKNYAYRFVQRALRCQEELGKEEALSSYPFILDLYDQLGDPIRVRDQLVNVLIAGRDTTACTLSWVFFLLVRHPDVLNRLRGEISCVTQETQEISRKHIRQMPYLKAVLDEPLRIYPQIPVNVRIASRTTILPRGGGQDGDAPILIPKGTGIGTSIYHMHRRKELYGEDANEFRPERWLTGELDGIGAGYMPFHSGPRTCLGKEFALSEASYAIIRIIQDYPNIQLPPDTSPEPVGQEKQSLTVVVSSAEGCNVVLGRPGKHT